MVIVRLNDGKHIPDKINETQNLNKIYGCIDEEGKYTLNNQ